MIYIWVRKILICDHSVIAFYFLASFVFKYRNFFFLLMGFFKKLSQRQSLSYLILKLHPHWLQFFNFLSFCWRQQKYQTAKRGIVKWEIEEDFISNMWTKNDIENLTCCFYTIHNTNTINNKWILQHSNILISPFVHKLTLTFINE